VCDIASVDAPDHLSGHHVTDSQWTSSCPRCYNYRKHGIGFRVSHPCFSHINSFCEIFINSDVSQFSTTRSAVVLAT